jgi:hypothetical protein
MHRYPAGMSECRTWLTEEELNPWVALRKRDLDENNARYAELVKENAKLKMQLREQRERVEALLKQALNNL